MTPSFFSPPLRPRLRPRLAPAFLRPWVPWLARLVSGPYLRLLGYTGLRVLGAESARALWTDFRSGKIRLVLAFRHALGNDPQLLTAAVVRGLRGRGSPPFLQFVHGVEVGWWAGPLARWILPRSGGIAIDHDALGPSAMDAIRSAIVHGGQPLALAPEGQVTYESRTVQRVQPGFARLGFLAAEDLAALGRTEPVLVLPVSLHHEYPPRTRKKLDRTVARLEIAVFGSPRSGRVGDRLSDLRDGLFTRAESWYAAHHRYGPGSGLWTKERALPLLESALTAGEQILGLPHSGEFFARLYRLRSAAWDRFYPDRAEWVTMTSLDRGLASRSVTEAWAAFRHLELADIGWYLWSLEPRDDSSTDFLADFLENLYDLMNRLRGGTIADRKVLFPRRVRVVFGAPINLSARLSDYRARKKETLAKVVAELVEEWNREQ